MCVFRGVSCYFQTLHATLIYLQDSNTLNAVLTIQTSSFGGLVCTLLFKSFGSLRLSLA